MKGSQVAGIAVGWLAVALSMAAIGSASVARVGIDTTEAQVQVTVARSTSTENSESAAPSNSYIPTAIAELTRPVISSVSTTQATKSSSSARTTPARATAKASSATAQKAPTSAATTAPITKAPVSTAPVVVPAVAAAEPTEAETSAPGASPTTKPSSGDTPRRPSGDKTSTASGSPAVVSFSFGTWRHAEGAIWAACKGASLTSVRPNASEGYEATERTGLVRTSVTFDGPRKLSVRVSCASGTPSFEIQD